MTGLLQMLQKYENNNIAIYGLGTETEKVLKEISGKFHIVGLLDGFKEDGVLYGQSIISFKEAIDSDVKLILVVARPGSCKAIAKRIGNVCIQNGIDLIDVRGRDLCAFRQITYDFKGVGGVTKSDLLQKINENSAVSFDLFDTLIMRQTLFVTDVYEIVEQRLRGMGIYIEDFCGKRLESEKSLSKTTAPTLVKIYAYMRDTYSISEIIPEELAELEWSVDYALIVPRREMCELVADVYKQGKKIYITSDTYYTKEQLIQILEKCDIIFYTDILASCEYGTGKQQNLYEKLHEKLQGKSCIHIGDDVVADVESAEKNGIAHCQIYSGIDLMESVGYLGLWDSITGLSSRIRVGMFVSKLFNSPFQFETEERKLSIQSPYDLGYLFFAPIICDFVIWFHEQVKCNRLQNIWFCARDGYLIKKIYDELNTNVRSTYFLTSRTAAIRAGMENENDIDCIGEMKFSGTLKEQLMERFGLSLTNREIKADHTLLDYSREILDQAAVNRRNYRTYIEKLNIKEGNIAFFDFVAKGTSQMYIGRLVSNKLKGFYFLQLEEEFMEKNGLDILPFYQKEEKEDSAIYEDYYILETMLTSPEPSIRGFDEGGMPVYSKETRSESDIRCFLSAQDGIFDYFKTYQQLCPKTKWEIDKKLDELLLSMIHKVSILHEDFLNLKVEDPFFNRMTAVTDLL